MKKGRLGPFWLDQKAGQIAPNILLILQYLSQNLQARFEGHNLAELGRGDKAE